MRWSEFEKRAPRLAKAFRERTEGKTIVVGTIRRDGTPRISPIGFEFAYGEIWMGMMWRTHKALDLLRDPRVLLHNAVTSDKDGEVKLRGRAVEINTKSRRERYRSLLRKRYGWAPEEPFHLFTVDIEHAALVTFGPRGLSAKTWP